MQRKVDLTRRQVVGAAGTTGIALLFGGLVRGEGGALDPEVAEAAATCVMTPAKTEGPYFVDEKLNRSDIRTDPTDGTTPTSSEAARIASLIAMTSLAERTVRFRIPL